MTELITQRVEELYASKFTRKFKGPEGRKKLLKVLNLALVHPVHEVAKVHNISPRIIYWWFKQIYCDEYNEIIKTPRVPYIINQKVKRNPHEDLTEYLIRMREQMVDIQENCKHDKWVMRCSTCGKIIGSDAKTEIDMTIGELLGIHERSHYLIQQTI